MAADMADGYAPATINRTLGAVKKALKLAWSRGAIATDYSSLIKRLPENNRRDTYLTIEEVGKLTSCASDNVRAAIWIALFTGCRRGEICKIAKEDVGEDTIRIQAGNTKTLRRRDVPIVSALRPWLPYLPLQINEEGIKSGFNRARIKAKLEHVNFHDLRHSCATIMLASGVDLYVISKILGHSTIKTTERYSHLQVDAQRNALEKAFG
jgi:integrase